MSKITLSVPYAAAGLPEPGAPALLEAVCLPFSSEIGRKKRPCVIVCPGGGYDFCSQRE